MSAQILNGKAVADALIAEIGTEVAQLRATGQRAPCLAVVLVGQDPASTIYVRNKKRDCQLAGIDSISHDLPASTSEAELLAIVDALNDDPAVDGILVQLPLPEQINANAVIARIRPDKDVDGFHPANVGCLALKTPALRPCTPRGVMVLLERAGIAVQGQDAVVVGASNIVGRPMALELLLARATVTICHSATRDLAAKVAQADIVVAATGIPGLVRGAWIKPGAVVVDVGINRLDDGSLCGDVEYEPAAARASYITPVPGGVGPMTRAVLLTNTLQAYHQRRKQPG